MDIYGTRAGIEQTNQRNEETTNHNLETQMYNNKLLQDYNKDKDEEGGLEDVGYVKDLLQNVNAGNSMGNAFSNRKKRIAKELVNSNKNPDNIPNKGSPLIEDINEKTLPTPEKPLPTPLTDDAPEGMTGNLFSGEDDEPTHPPPPQVEPSPSTTSPSTVGEETTVNAGEPTPSGESAPKVEANSDDSSFLTKGINKVSGGAIALDSAETIGKVGGAVIGAGYGAVNLGEDIDNAIKNHGNPFKKGASWEDDANNVGQVIGGISDVVGLVPGLEWVAGVGNLVSGVGSLLNMFGDHKKNDQKQANINAMKGKVKPLDAVAQTTGTIAYSDTVGKLQQTAQATTSATF